MTALLSSPLTLPCGATLPNRLCKAAMTEGLANPQLQATPELETLYRRWSEGGAGLLLTGNVQIDRRVLERPGNVAIDNNGGEAALRAWAKAGTVNGNHLWMQISHAGRQSPRYVTGRPLGPSAVQLDMLGNYAKPRALTEDEILDFIQRFARVAVTARDTGFTGVQVHSAHGYLLSSFLSPVTNRRTDAWGGSLENRARFLLETLRAVRKAVGDDFPVALKLNSDDFRKGGFSNEDCLQVVEWLNSERVDLLEISGGTYEQPQLLGFSGKADSAAPQRASTRAREAYFLDYAEGIRKVAKMPMMVTGGFRTTAGMEAALQEGHCDVIGLGRPLCTDTDAPARALRGELPVMPAYEKTLKLGNARWLSGASPIFLFKILNVLGQQGWYYQQIARLGHGQAPDLGRGVLKAFFAYLWDEYKTAFRVWRAR
ncbi:NADH:flavin oxidoreductase/NADH oxidase family protein [Flagellatimonas centrodinii]|uniref:NADH:flavin oxidoreductase/NADH oxidase family protein n=1 Tax=Flagellatimonas centrodinii TaxID=2806210 RepID=UPI001FEDF3A1|nr:NADH:flavin oxidoreductase/NADH oxidase family protein [Flagellatimonas centrodinii]ULQ47890.1 NADH:flavin oxidoreductase/NADH oxidase family protein [Flagellatimonas centrodinii]